MNAHTPSHSPTAVASGTAIALDVSSCDSTNSTSLTPTGSSQSCR
jgi:hypothetical protein